MNMLTTFDQTCTVRIAKEKQSIKIQKTCSFSRREWNVNSETKMWLLKRSVPLKEDKCFELCQQFICPKASEELPRIHPSQSVLRSINLFERFCLEKMRQRISSHKATLEVVFPRFISQCSVNHVLKGHCSHDPMGTSHCFSCREIFMSSIKCWLCGPAKCHSSRVKSLS